MTLLLYDCFYAHICIINATHVDGRCFGRAVAALPAALRSGAAPTARARARGGGCLLSRLPPTRVGPGRPPPAQGSELAIGELAELQEQTQPNVSRHAGAL